MKYRSKQTIIPKSVTCISKSTVFLSKRFLVKNTSLSERFDPAFDPFPSNSVLKFESIDEQFM
ncbi:hypothetical protein, partial [Vibrio sp. 10N.222.46.A1]|uniref:hypothetical protein n=1 Tax=Vibrio sp. 10N.222.46.A1 TaxID=3229599 RepID=UPI00354F7EDC